MSDAPLHQYLLFKFKNKIKCSVLLHDCTILTYKKQIFPITQNIFLTNSYLSRLMTQASPEKKH